MQLMSERAFHGTGWQFPIRVNSRGRFVWSSGEQHIQESIWMILSTGIGERQMEPNFGCGIHDLVFAGNHGTTHGAVMHTIRQALSKWEPRIDVLDVRVGAPAENQLLIRIDYRVRATNNFHNLVYPFYIREGRNAAA